MSNTAIAAAARSARLAPLAFGLAVTAVAGWIVAALRMDELFLLVALVGATAAALGVEAWRDARRDGSPPRLAVAATLLGGLVAGQIVVYTVVYAISELL